MLVNLFRRSSRRVTVARLHGDIVAAVRQPAFFSEYGVADTFDGRFELLALLSSLAVMRLSELSEPGPRMAQELTDSLFQRLDDDLREMGVGDLAVPKRIKKLAAALLGRRKAYAEALAAEDDHALAEALARNVHGGVWDAQDAKTIHLCRYVRAAVRALAEAPLEVFERGPLRFPAAAEHAEFGLNDAH